MYPILIPSKGRAKTCTFCHNLKTTHRKFYIFIYKTDATSYLKYFPSENLIIVPNSVNGIASKRQYMLETARAMNCGWFWMVDDDIEKFYYRPLENYTGKLKALKLERFFSLAEKFVVKLDPFNKIFQIGFKKGSFGLTASPITCNTDIGEINLLNVREMASNYNINMVALEDTDLCITH